MALRIFFATKSNIKPAFRTINLQAVSQNNVFSCNTLNLTFCFQGFYSSKTQPEIPKNQLQGLITADQQKSNGVCYDKKPFKMVLQAGKRFLVLSLSVQLNTEFSSALGKNYSWCLCGKGHSQPLCDGTHKNQFLKIEQKYVFLYYFF